MWVVSAKKRRSGGWLRKDKEAQSQSGTKWKPDDGVVWRWFAAGAAETVAHRIPQGPWLPRASVCAGRHQCVETRRPYRLVRADDAVAAGGDDDNDNDDDRRTVLRNSAYDDGRQRRQRLSRSGQHRLSFGDSPSNRADGRRRNDCFFRHRPTVLCSSCHSASRAAGWLRFQRTEMQTQMQARHRTQASGGGTAASSSPDVQVLLASTLFYSRGESPAAHGSSAA